MQTDPVQEWQRLTEHYRQMSDDELRNLAIDFADLTETAQQVLRGEMRNRGLGGPRTAADATEIAEFSGSNPPDSVFAPSIVPSASAIPATANAKDPVARESIRRLPLCECGDWTQAWQICQALKAEGIESWMQDARPYIEDSLVYSPEMGPPPAPISQYAFRVLVAADQLDDARAIAERPIPREIAEASAADIPDFTPPRCPKCRAEDPVLLSVDPVNMWRCEQCGAEWTDPPGIDGAGGAEIGQKSA